MQNVQQLKAVPDDELVRRLGTILHDSRRTEADIVAHMSEVDARRLYAREASPSMFAYCLERLHFSEHEAFVRIAAGRACREHPMILDMLADGRLHLTGVALVAPHLTLENRDVVLQRATHKTKRQIEELVAELAPRPDVHPSIRKLPRGRVVLSSRPLERFDTAHASPPVVPSMLGGETPGRELRPEQVDSSALAAMDALPGSGSEPRMAKGEGTPAATHEPDPDGTPSGTRKPALDVRWAARQESRPSAIEPLSAARYRVQFTASTELRDKLERLKALMRASVPDGDLAAVIEAAVTEKIERLEARRFGRTRSPRKQPQASSVADSGEKPPMCARTTARPSSRHVPAAVRRAVYDRDQGRCRFVDAQGRRCSARVDLELHHRLPFAVGGEHSPSQMSLLCEAHNRLMAEIDFGANAVRRHRRERAGSPRTRDPETSPSPASHTASSRRPPPPPNVLAEPQRRRPAE